MRELPGRRRADQRSQALPSRLRGPSVRGMCRLPAAPPRTLPSAGLALALALALLVACGRTVLPARRPVALSVDVLADTGRAARLHLAPPRAMRVWLTRVSPSRAPAPAPPLPAPETGTVPSLPSPPELAVDEGLKSPVLRGPALLRPPPTAARAGQVELEVRVDEAGTVSDASWAGGSDDSALVAAARACALGMRFYPALRGGRPVAVWCRQRFDFGGNGR
ncbi:MAG: TonB family protein [Candidatus Eisenbacteria bacterium]|nr:TonB family protein [Candidatus Eisenbacteria bacterium]